MGRMMFRHWAIDGISGGKLMIALISAVILASCTPDPLAYEDDPTLITRNLTEASAEVVCRKVDTDGYEDLTADFAGTGEDVIPYQHSMQLSPDRKTFVVKNISNGCAVVVNTGHPIEDVVNLFTIAPVSHRQFGEIGLEIVRVSRDENKFCEDNLSKALSIKYNKPEVYTRSGYGTICGSYYYSRQTWIEFSSRGGTIYLIIVGRYIYFWEEQT